MGDTGQFPVSIDFNSSALMAEQVPSPTHSVATSRASPISQHNGRVLSDSPVPHRDTVPAGRGSCSPRPSATPRSPLRHILSLASRAGAGCPSARPSTASARISTQHAESNGPRIRASSNKARRSAKEVSHSQTEELLDLIAEAQRQRMEDQRAPGPEVVSSTTSHTWVAAWGGGDSSPSSARPSDLPERSQTRSQTLRPA
ncbi:hypothetical protein CRUP_029731 [Coryphaenoides rupestris]|nr:hypothetical protein CRUP_029731 [Coryphaenoides rupestris]